uniref:Uncharacterized protein n=1 Tax=Arundo donax TaxID=35708 RepID=A0A0A8XZE5_ARUDO
MSIPSQGRPCLLQTSKECKNRYILQQKNMKEVLHILQRKNAWGPFYSKVVFDGEVPGTWHIDRIWVPNTHDNHWCKHIRWIR